ncbi:Cofilin-1 [Manis pentadactyla]|nr:Cofilin-1 [Manis pentadactyla]
MDMTPTPLDINFRSTPTPHEAVFSTTACLVCASDDHRAGGLHTGTTTSHLKVSCLCKADIQGQTTDKALVSTSADPMTCSDARDEPMDTTPPKLAIIVWSPPAQHDAVGSTTTGLLCASENHCTGSSHLVFPGPIRCRGRHRRRHRP